MKTTHKLLAASLLITTATSSIAAGGIGIISNLTSNTSTTVRCPFTLPMSYQDQTTASTVSVNNNTKTGEFYGAQLSKDTPSLSTTQYNSITCFYTVNTSSDPGHIGPTTQIRQYKLTLPAKHNFAIPPANAAHWQYNMSNNTIFCSSNPNSNQARSCSVIKS